MAEVIQWIVSVGAFFGVAWLFVIGPSNRRKRSDTQAIVFEGELGPEAKHAVDSYLRTRTTWFVGIAAVLAGLFGYVLGEWHKVQLEARAEETVQTAQRYLVAMNTEQQIAVARTKDAQVSAQEAATSADVAATKAQTLSTVASRELAKVQVLLERDYAKLAGGALKL